MRVAFLVVAGLVEHRRGKARGGGDHRRPHPSRNARAEDGRRRPRTGPTALFMCMLPPGEAGCHRVCDQASAARPQRSPAALRTGAGRPYCRAPSSSARSGCGIMPSTLPASLRMPAMPRAEPLTSSAIAEGHAALAFEPVERRCVGLVIAVVVRDRDEDVLARIILRGEQALAVLDLQRHRPADEVEAGVAHQRARQKPRLGQHLEAVADAQHGHAARRPRRTPRA